MKFLPALLLPLSAPLVLFAAEDRPASTPPHVTGRLLSVNGTTEVPRGLFGVHATPLTPEIVADWGVESTRQIYQHPSGEPSVPGTTPGVPAGIVLPVDCYFDRYQPAFPLHDPAWEKRLTDLARRYGEKSRELPGRHCVEFWNEPFLNWAVKPGVNYDGAFFEESDLVEGGPMTLKGERLPLEHLVWDSKLVAVGDDGKVDYLASSYAIPLIDKGELAEGDSYDFRGQRTLTIARRPWGRDPTQKSYYSGQQNRFFYEAMLLPFAKTLKETNPDVELVAGWDFHIFQNDWDAWETLYKPLVDGFAPWIDGISEHHYGEDTRRVAASYETVAAYARTRYDKDLKFYNTEAGGTLDPQRPDSVGAPIFTADSEDSRKGALMYMLRDIVYLVDQCPDKAVARAAHEAHNNLGVQAAFRLLKNLRGTLIETISPHPDVWLVASLDENRLTAVAFNDSAEPVADPIRFNAPEGTTFTGASSTVADGTTGELAVTEQEMTPGSTWEYSPTIPAKSAVRFDLTLSGTPPQAAQIARTQFFASDILARLAPGESVKMEIRIPEERGEASDSAVLKLARQGFETLTCTVNGQPVPLGTGNVAIEEAPVEVANLKPVNIVEFTCPPDGPGGIVNMASLVLTEVPANP